jgi:hypothetical protein
MPDNPISSDQTQPAPPPDGAIRPGAPGKPSDMVTSTRVQPAPRPKADKPPEVKDAWREIIETVVFVVVLVFMLKTFLAEAFVIPTGSMATTLLGYHRDVPCAQCGYEYRVNCSTEAEPQPNRQKEDVVTSDCPNCAFRNRIR